MTEQTLAPTNPTPANAVLVRQSEFFSSLPPALLSDMSQQFRTEEWLKSAYIHPDILLSRFHILLNGQLEMKRSNPETGRELTLDLLTSGDSFDVITLLDNQAHDVVLQPLSDLKLISVSMEAMRRWLWTYPELNQQFLPYLANKMREQEDLSSSLVLHDTPTRLSRIILKNICKFKAFRGKPDEACKDHLVHGFSDDLLARLIGSVRQVVNKQLGLWKKQGILDKKRNEIIIHDLEALNQEAKLAESQIKQNQRL